jgi:hypothetical protein
MQSEANKISREELERLFPAGLPMAVAKLLFPEKSEQMTIDEIRYLVRSAALSAAPSVTVKDASSPDLLLYNLLMEAINEGVAKVNDPDWTTKDFGKSPYYQAIHAALSAQVQDVADEDLRKACEAFAEASAIYPDGEARTPITDWFDLDAQDAVDFGVLKEPSWHGHSDIRGMQQEQYIAAVVKEPMRAALLALQEKR